jgi:hypothetical protein
MSYPLFLYELHYVHSPVVPGLTEKDRRLKIKLTISLILRINLKLGGYSIWSASLIAPHIKKTGQLLGA